MLATFVIWIKSNYLINNNITLVQKLRVTLRYLIYIKSQFSFINDNTLCSKKSDAKIQITITTVYLIRIKYPLSGFNYHLSDVNAANFNKIHRTVSEQQLF